MCLSECVYVCVLVCMTLLVVEGAAVTMRVKSTPSRRALHHRGRGGAGLWLFPFISHKPLHPGTFLLLGSYEVICSKGWHGLCYVWDLIPELVPTRSQTGVGSRPPPPTTHPYSIPSGMKLDPRLQHVNSITLLSVLTSSPPCSSCLLFTILLG